MEEEDGDGAGDSVGHVGAGPVRRLLYPIASSLSLKATWTASRSRRAKGTVIPETQPEDGVEDDEEGEEGARPSRWRR